MDLSKSRVHIFIGRCLIFIVLLAVVYFYSQFIYLTNEYYKIKSIDLVEVYDNFNTSILKAYKDMKHIQNYGFVPLANVILFICLVFASNKLILSFVLSLVYSHDGIFTIQNNYSTFIIISVFAAYKAIKSFEESNSKRSVYIYLAISNIFAIIVIEWHILPFVISLSVSITCLFKIPNYFIIKNKITILSQSVIPLLSYSIAYAITDIITSSFPLYKSIKIRVVDIYSLIFTPTDVSKHIRCKLSNNSITTLIFIYAVFDRQNKIWKYIFPILIPGFIGLFFKSTIFELRISTNECRSTNYYDLRIIAYLLISLVVVSNNNILYSTIFTLALLVSSYIWRFETIPFLTF